MELHGKISRPPLLIIHAGAGAKITDEEYRKGRNAANIFAVQTVWRELLVGLCAVKAASYAMSLLEKSPYSNAGVGAYLQRDGVARLTASLMGSDKEKFSSVSLVTSIDNPSFLAAELQNRNNSSLGPYGAQLLARELGIAPASPLTERAINQWRSGTKFPDALKNISESNPTGGTVGVVVVDKSAQLAAATSTGGGGPHDYPERISDVGTVAANYSTRFAAISCTGIGEQIRDDALAARLETRVRDGSSIREASDKCLREAQEKSRSYGWIAADSRLVWAARYTTERMPSVIMHSDLKEPVSFGV